MRRTTTAVSAVVAALAVAAPLTASPPMDGTGVGTILVRSTTTIRTADGNVIQERETTGDIVGFFDGTYTLTVRGVVHKGEFVTFHGVMTFTGVADGCGVGTVLLEFEGKAIPGDIPVADGRLRTIDSADNTANVHVIGTFHQVGAIFTYEGQFHCD